MKYCLLPLLIIATLSQAKGNHSDDSRYHEMQHGFILSNDDTLGSHLVASGHHSRQTEIVGELHISDANEEAHYRQRKEESTINQSYFLFQAQNLDLPTLKDGEVLRGHIIESKVGMYQPKNIVVNDAVFVVKKVMLNIVNPFFQGEFGAHKQTGTSLNR